jgi:hypothetical protein
MGFSVLRGNPAAAECNYEMSMLSELRYAGRQALQEHCAVSVTKTRCTAHGRIQQQDGNTPAEMSGS